MARRTAVQKAAMIEALHKSLGVVTTACKAVGITNTTHYDWYKKDEEYRDAVDAVKNTVLDFAESQLLKNIKDGKETSLIFFLKCHGQKRGYIEKQQIEHTVKPLYENALEFFEMPEEEPEAIEKKNEDEDNT